MIEDNVTLRLQVGSVQGGKKKKYRCRFVRAGEVKTASGQPAGIVIQAEALRLAVELFDQKAVFIDHAGWLDAPSLRNLVGVTSAPVFNDVEQSIDGDVQFFDTDSAAEIAVILDEILSDPEQAPDVGLSIVFYPTWQFDEATGKRTVVAIKAVESVDLVFQPAADGRVLEALSAKKVGRGRARTNADNFVDNPQELGDNDSRKGVSMADEVVSTPVVADGSADDLQAWQAAALQAARQSATASMIAGSGLPQAAQERLRGMEFATPVELQAMIERERTYLAALAADQVIQIGGQPPRSPQITGMLNELDKMQMALDALMAGVRPADGIRPLTGIRELYHALSGDYEMSGVFQPERVQFANVNSSTMANLVANALNKVVVNEFQQYPQWWRPIVNEMDFASLQAVKWMTVGGVGELPTVAEGAAYTELTWDDSYETASFVKKGGYLGLTIEAIDKDDTGRLRTAPRALAQAAWLTLSKSVSYIFTQESGTGPLVSDATRLFTSGHGNLGSSALSITTWNAARLAMRKMTELNSSERLGALTAPKYLLVPPDLEVTALQVLGAEADYLYALSNGQAAPPNVNAIGADREARLTSARQRVIVVDLWTDTNDWAAVADPKLWPTIGIGYRYGRQPEIYSVASPTAGLMFSNDTMPVKVRFVYAVGPQDYRGLYKANV